MSDTPCTGAAMRRRQTGDGGSGSLPLERAAARLGVSLDATARAAARRLPLRFPAEYIELADPADPQDPIRRIAWPDPEELEAGEGAFDDPVGERGLREHPLVIRKYRNRAILLVTHRCHFYCRFCFRAGQVPEPAAGELEQALDVLAGLEGLEEVILSGGDPLVLPDRRLIGLLRQLGRRLPGVALRIHTRAPVHAPERITAALVEELAGLAKRPPWIVLHLTHPRELRESFDQALALLAGAGLPLTSQTVLLRGVNADPGQLARLFGGLYTRGVRPYYLHHPDRVPGTRRFWLGLDEGRRIYRELRSLVTGPALPHYVIDLPDGSGKVPVDWLEEEAPGEWVVHRPGMPPSRYLDFADAGVSGHRQHP